MIVNPRNIVYIGSMGSQSHLIYEHMEVAGALPSQLLGYEQNISRSIRITAKDPDWIRLDRILNSNEEIFYAVGRSQDQIIGLDEQGYMYCSKDYAIQILEEQLRAVKLTKDVTQNWAYILTGLLGVSILARVFG